jgi:hypothetical protein
LDEEGFKGFLAKRKLRGETVQAHIRMVKRFEAFLKKKDKNKDLGKATPHDMEIFVVLLTKSRLNTEDNLIALLRYAYFTANRDLAVALLELIDGSQVLQNLSNKVKKMVGESKHKEVFGGIELPPLGTHSRDKPRTTKEVMERLEAKLDEKSCKEALSSGLHGPIPDAVFMSDKRKFQNSKSLNDFLKKRHEEYVRELEEHMKNKTLYFTQEIDEEVVEYVRDTPTCQNGVKEGDVIIVTKIPYMAKKYLHEKDPRMKRYYACHCTWVREAIKTDTEISPNFCYCSAGFEKRPWDVVFGQPVKADVIETVLKGDMTCKFAIHIPKEFR